MGIDIANLKVHDIYKLVPRTPGMHTLQLGWFLHHKCKNGNNTSLSTQTLKEEPPPMEQPDGHAATGQEIWGWKLKKGYTG